MAQKREAADWITITDLAQLVGLDKSQVSRKVARLERGGYLRARAGPGKAKLICPADYLRALKQAAEGAPPNGRGGDEFVLVAEQARRTAAQADIAEFDRGVKLKSLLHRDHVRQAHADAAGEMGRILDSLPTHLDAILAAVASGGKPAGRAVLRDIGTNVRTALAKAVDPETAEIEDEPEIEA